MKNSKVQINTERLKFTICKYTSVDYMTAFNDTSRKRDAVEARQIFCYLMHKLTILSTVQIGASVYKSKFLSYDHSTVIFSIKNVKGLLETNKIFKDKFEAIINDFRTFQESDSKTNYTQAQKFLDKKPQRFKTKNPIICNNY